MQALCCDDEMPEDASSTPHAITHAPEALRYALMSRYGASERRDETKERPHFRFASERSVWDV